MPAMMASSTRAPPMTAPTIEFLAASSWSSTGEVSSSRAIMVASISTWPISSVPMSMIMSLYFCGPRQFQPWNRYVIMTLISPHCPPSGSCSIFANSGSGLSGFAWYCSWLRRMNMSRLLGMECLPAGARIRAPGARSGRRSEVEPSRVRR